MVSAKVYLEGGGNGKTLKTACRKGFAKFIEKAGGAGKMPQIVACGSRGNAYGDFSKAHAAGVAALLLIDAECPVTAHGSWQHLQMTDGWNRPPNATDDQCHLMVEVLESWFLADVDALQLFYGQGFLKQALPANPQIENVSKQDVLTGLGQATQNTKKGRYKKGSESFQILEILDPDKVRKVSVHADNLIQALC